MILSYSWRECWLINAEGDLNILVRITMHTREGGINHFSTAGTLLNNYPDFFYSIIGQFTSICESYGNVMPAGIEACSLISID